MGLKSGFNKFLRDTCPEVFEEIHLSEYGYKKVAIDISLYLHKYKAVCGDRWLVAFINLISSLRRNELHCVFIFDGKSPIEKEGEQNKRRENRDNMQTNLYDLEEAFEEYSKTGVINECLKNLYHKRRRSPSANKRLLGKNNDDKEEIDMIWVENKIKQRKDQLYQVTPKDFEDAKELFEILKVPYFVAPWEAEKLCSKLCIDGKVCAVLSEDTDVIAYSAPVFLTKIDTGNDSCIRIEYDDVLSKLDLNQQQFLDFCILCGTDYNTNIPRVGSKTAYKRIVEHGGIEQIGEETVLDTSILNYHRVRELFTEFDENEYNIEKIPFCGSPDFEKLQEFIVEHDIHINIDKLRKDFTHNIIIFEDDEE